MATFVKVERKNGICWQAVIRRKGFRPIKKTFDLKGDAKTWASEQEALIRAKRFKDPRLAQQALLGKALDKYREECRAKGKAVSTLDRERYSKRHLERILGKNTPLGDIDGALVNIYQNQRIRENASNSSIRQELAMLSKMFRIARKTWKIPVDNPVDDVDRIPPTPGRQRFLTSEEARLVIQEAKTLRNRKFYPFVVLLMHTGMRTGEAARLHQDNINLEKRYIVIEKTKSGRPRTVPMTKTVAEALASLEPGKDGFFFLKPEHRHSSSTMLRPGSIFRSCWQQVWRQLKNKAEDQQAYPGFPVIPHFKPHDIRHTAASHLLMAGVDIRVIADILGHSTLKMAMRYTHTLDSYRLEVIDKIDHLGT
ncbi:hypothetical protein DGMP_06760 [Desulfomarina profundi]|uniref:Site-specific integrase n=1 Tax=Desulfomarina profundi TaxID=2772557 RepID=A0A8D5FET3_9BACT|nr:site-specific integrase [Desulfomarina profundi]BCL59983.1 hypothetical protein DGMP_06760 [Desulfomarina profundi]